MINNEDKALEALLAAASRLEFSDELSDEHVEQILKQKINLSQEDEDTLDMLDDNFINNILDGRKVQFTKTSSTVDEELKSEHYAMNRDAEGGDINEDVRRKIDEARKRAIERKRKKDKNENDGANS